MGTYPRVGQVGEPFVKHTKRGSFMSYGKKRDIVRSLSTEKSASNYEKLYNIDVVGLNMSHYNYVYEKVQKQFKRDEECWHKTVLVWKELNVPLGVIKNGRLGRLKSFVKNLKQDSQIYKAHVTVLQEQLQNRTTDFK